MTTHENHNTHDTAHAARLQKAVEDAERDVRRVLEEQVRGPGKRYLSRAAARDRLANLQNAVDSDEARGSLRHRTVPFGARIVTLLFLCVVDFPLMLWLAGSVFNVDWARPLGLPLMVSAVVSVLGTGGSAWVLHHLGRNRREDKDDRRRLDWHAMSVGARSSVVAVGVLVAMMAAVMYVRVYTEGVLSGLAELAVLLAVLVAFIMLLSAALVFFTAFRDGSTTQDDLASLSRIVAAGTERVHLLDDVVARRRAELDLLVGRAPAGASDGAVLDPAGALGVFRPENVRRPKGGVAER